MWKNIKVKQCNTGGVNDGGRPLFLYHTEFINYLFHYLLIGTFLGRSF